MRITNAVTNLFKGSSYRKHRKAGRKDDIPVSYTHLDVYKRQATRCPHCTSALPNEEEAADEVASE